MKRAEEQLPSARILEAQYFVLGVFAFRYRSLIIWRDKLLDRTSSLAGRGCILLEF